MLLYNCFINNLNKARPGFMFENVTLFAIPNDVLKLGMRFNSKEGIYKLQDYPVVYPATFLKSKSFVLKKRIYTRNSDNENVHTQRIMEFILT